MSNRYANYAGKFYPSDQNELRLNIEKYLTPESNRIYANSPDGQSITLPTKDVRPKAIIVPHAGYIYSGGVAGCAYSYLKNNLYDEVFILGVSHSSRVGNLVISDYQGWDTPLGTIDQSPRIVDLAKDNPDIFSINNTIHDNEHALEVQLPFIQTVLNKNIKILPILVGANSPRILANELIPLIGENDLIVVSTDLSHYYPNEVAIKKDQGTIKAILNNQTDEIEEAGKVNYQGDIEACGLYAVNILVQIALQKNWDSRLIGYANSGTISGDMERVVGYGSILYF